MDTPKDKESQVSFEDFKLNKQVLDAIADAGLEHPTEIQEKAIPQIMAGHDIFGIAPTGTGKTAAFILPILMKLRYPQGDHARVLILGPTRELISQVADEARKFAKNTGLRVVELYGGIGPKTQIENIQAGADVIVATPGRFLDIYSRGEMVVKLIKTLILDEADKMMDMGFMPQIRQILEVIPTKRQNLLFSATIPQKVEKLSEEFLEFPVKVQVALTQTTAITVSQEKYLTPNLKTKINLLLHLLTTNDDFERAIVFVKKRGHADAVFKYLERKNLGDVRVIHANKGQNTRMNSIEAFKAGGVRVLVATDVMARGIDVLDVSHVINFDVPLIYEDYIHRIGRTGRAFKSGISITFVTPAEEYHFDRIEKLIKQKVPIAHIPKGVEIVKTPKAEEQEMLREIDEQNRRENPEFKGAFHEKKERKFSKSKSSKSKRNPKRK